MGKNNMNASVQRIFSNSFEKKFYLENIYL